jgi:hypothetical protein
LSKKFHWWCDERMKEGNKRWLSRFKDEYEFFNTAGSGQVAISKDMHITGSAAGVGMSVSWGVSGFHGTVLGFTEARKMAEYILAKCNEQDKPEEQIYTDFFKEQDRKYQEYLNSL